MSVKAVTPIKIRSANGCDGYINGIFYGSENEARGRRDIEDGRPETEIYRFVGYVDVDGKRIEKVWNRRGDEKTDPIFDLLMTYENTAEEIEILQRQCDGLLSVKA